MNWLGLIFGILIVGVIVYLMSQRKKEDLGGRQLILDGVKYGYNINQIEAKVAERLAGQLRTVVVKLWPLLAEIYGETPKVVLSSVAFDTEFEHIIKLARRNGTVRMRPQGGQGSPAVLWFSREMHNQFRAWALGFNHTYPKPDEVEQWKLGEQACAAVVRALTMPID